MVAFWQFLIARHTDSYVALLIQVKLCRNETNVVAAHVAEMIYRTLFSFEKVSPIGTNLLSAWQFSALITISNHLSFGGALSTKRPTNFSLLTCLASNSDIG
jgi:hypothetical protein